MNANAYEQYYLRQAQGGGGGIPIFRGVGVQRGHGLGNLLNAAVRMIVPGLTKKVLLRQGLRTGANIVGDIVSGRSVKESIKQRAVEGGKSLLSQSFARSGFVPPPTRKRKPAKRGKVKKRPVRRKRPQSGAGLGGVRRRRRTKTRSQIRCVKRRKHPAAGDIFSY